jgi:hypothetical protein
VFTSFTFYFVTSYILVYRSRVSSVNILITGWRSMESGFNSWQSDWLSYLMDTGNSFPGVKRLVRVAEYSLPSVGGVKSVWSCTATLSQVLFLVKHRDTSALYHT